MNELIKSHKNPNTQQQVNFEYLEYKTLRPGRQYYTTDHTTFSTTDNQKKNPKRSKPNQHTCSLLILINKQN